MKNALFLATITFLGMTAVPAEASIYTFSWVTANNSNSNLGLSYSETVNGITLTALALTASSNLTAPATAGPDLYAKSGGSSETGLGMATDPAGDHEISAALNDGIQVDFANAIAAAPNATATMVISSLQSGEGFALYGSNTALTVAGNSKSDGALGEPLLTGTGSNSNPNVTITLPDWGQYTYYTLMATDPGNCSPDANILLGTVTINGGITTQATPEPGSLLLAGTAFIAVGVLLKKKQKKS